MKYVHVYVLIMAPSFQVVPIKSGHSPPPEWNKGFFANWDMPMEKKNTFKNNLKTILHLSKYYNFKSVHLANDKSKILGISWRGFFNISLPREQNVNYVPDVPISVVHWKNFSNKHFLTFTRTHAPKWTCCWGRNPVTSLRVTVSPLSIGDTL